MKNKLFHRLTAALCALVLALTLVPTAQAAGTPASSNNRNGNSYPGTGAGGGYWADTVDSYLYANASGGLTRVEYIGDGKIVAEDYSSSFQLQSSRTIPFELSLWGGFFAGENYNFIIFGQNNPNESDSVEVIRVVKYDKSWNRLGQASVYGADTYQPFDAGSLRCAETGGNLYIHTCHTMYKSSDGKNHQSNMNIFVRESDMSVINDGQNTRNYVSHSFNQFVLVDQQGNLVTLDHGDGYPRALVVHQWSFTPYEESRESNIHEFPGATGNNATNGTAGALAETSTGYLTAYNHDDPTSGWASRKVYLGYTDKSTMTSRSVLVSSERTLSAPHLTPTGLNGGWILFNGMDSKHWYVDDTLYYASYTANGEVGEVRKAENAPLSDCAPIQFNGKTVWYTTNDSAPVFYTLDASGVTATPANGSPAPATPEKKPTTPVVTGVTFSDVPASHWAYQDIMGAVSLGAVNGFADGRFQPEDPVTIPQFCIMVGRAFYPEVLAEYQEKPDYAGKPWYVPVCDFSWLGSYGSAPALFHYVQFDFKKFNHYNDWSGIQNEPLTRFNMALMIDVVYDEEKGYENFNAEENKAILRTIADYDKDAWGYHLPDVVAKCIKAGLMTGMPDGTFSGNKTVTRAQACAVINRLYAAINS